MRTRKQKTGELKTNTAESLDAALIVLQSNTVVVVPEAVWADVRAKEAHSPFIHEGRFLLLRGEADKTVVWCDTPQPYALNKRAWISHSLLSGYMNEFKLYCLLQLQPDDHVIPTPKGILTPHELGRLNQRLQQQAWETPTWERDRCFPSFPPPLTL